MFETLVQERVEILENQKRLEAQLLTVAVLTSSVIRRSTRSLFRPLRFYTMNEVMTLHAIEHDIRSL
ncbi:hypothetical protein PIB30_087201 [Stylosanthes scabra]|uniref:Uncharacterized protein n=1 Tax=Stylosanthes scabra TaxID=79078 RepID=A0ABU6RUA3_9FABA|nr:hypothetical protein [Stylosanthes scabra]